MSVTARGTRPSCSLAFPGAYAHHREMCMRIPLVLNGPPRHASQYSTFSPCSRSSRAAKSGLSAAPRHARPTRPGATFTNAGSPLQHAFTVLLGCRTDVQSFRPNFWVVSTISERSMPCAPAFLSTRKQMPLIVPLPIRAWTSSSVSLETSFGGLASFGAPPSFFFSGVFCCLEDPPFDDPPPPAASDPSGGASHVTTPSSMHTSVTPELPPGALSQRTV